MKTVFYNGKVYVDREVFAEAVLVTDNIIEKVGTNEEIKSLADVDTKMIDCEGKTLIPGLNDSHIHLIWIGLGLNQVSISECKTIDEIIETCKKFIEENPEAAESGIHSVGWNQDLFIDEKRIPNRHDLDRISTEIPIVLERVCSHVVSSNTKAIELLGLTADSPQFEGGTFEIEDGYPNGVFNENATKHILSVIPDPTKEDIERMMLQAMDYAIQFGITSVQSNDVGNSPLKRDEVFALFHKVYDEKIAKIRYRHQLRIDGVEELQDYIDTEYKKGDYSNPLLTLGPLKCFKDGSLGGRTGTMRQGYADDPDNYGVESLSDELQNKYLKIATANGMQVVTHVIGDKAIDDTIRNYKKYMSNNNEQRLALVHCQITDKGLVEDICKNNIYVMAQPIFLDYDMKVVEQRVGKELASTSYAFKSLKDGGCHVSYGTDSPVEDIDPWMNLYMAVTRKDKKGFPEGGFYPEECVDVYEAVDAYTLESARVMFMEDKLGRIKKGYFADMILLDKDIFTVDPMEIKDIRPVLSMVNGEIIFTRE